MILVFSIVNIVYGPACVGGANILGGGGLSSYYFGDNLPAALSKSPLTHLIRAHLSTSHGSRFLHNPHVKKWTQIYIKKRQKNKTNKKRNDQVIVYV